jgi:hypothetical protein
VEHQDIEYCEHKADDVQVSAEESRTGRYVIRGRIFGRDALAGALVRALRARLPQRGRRPSPPAARVNGGFAAEPEGE